MSNCRKYSVSFSGVGSDARHDGRMRVDYLDVISDASYEEVVASLDIGEVDYDVFFPDLTSLAPMVLTYNSESSMTSDVDEGIYGLIDGANNSYSFYRREYERYKHKTDDGVYEYKEFKGEWKPVAVNVNSGFFRDFNVSNDRVYQYIMYPADNIDGTEMRNTQLFANADLTDEGDNDVTTSAKWGAPIVTKWNEWSLIELEPVENARDVPIVKKTYRANLEQMWLFKYDLDVGAQTQNITREEIQTLGQFHKIGYGQQNFVSGEVTALLGSEIVPYTKQGYVERLWMSKSTTLSTNERTEMLKQWRALVSSKNPKLLKDMKGQSWIVQITGGSNTPKNWYYKQPDTISFQWKQIEDTENVVIYGGSKNVYMACGDAGWEPIFKNSSTCCPQSKPKSGGTVIDSVDYTDI